MTRRRYLILATLLIALLLGGTLLVSNPQTGETPIEGWIGHELEGVANHYLNPTLHFQKLAYTYPRTVLLEGVTLDTPDPTGAARDLSFFSAKRVQLTLAQIPRVGQPLRIRELYLDRPELRLVSLKPHEASKVGGQQHKAHFAGFYHFLAKRHAPGKPKKPPSDVFEIRKVDIHDGLIEYDPRMANTKPFVLDGLNMQLDISAAGVDGVTPAPGQGAKSGWYLVKGKASREPIFEVQEEGRFNIDTMTLEFSPLTARLTLNPGTSNRLPPQLQKVVEKFQAAGDLKVLLTGTLAMKDKEKTFLLTHLDLNHGHLRLGKYDVPAERVEADLTTAHRETRAKKIEADILGGRVVAKGVLPFDRTKSAALYIQAEHVGLARTIRMLHRAGGARGAATAASPYAGGAAPTRMAGLISGDVSYVGPIAHWKTEASGEGDLTLTHGRLPDIPLIGDIVKGISDLGKAVGLADGKPNDQAEMKFAFAGNKAVVKELTAHSGSWALRGDGDIYLNGDLDMRVNAGPLERMEIMFGPVGKALGSLTDAIVGYRVTGRVGRPQVSLEVGPG